MYDDDIGLFVVCFQIFSLDTDIVPHLYRCWFFLCGHQFSLIFINVVNHIVTYKINCTLLWTTLGATFWVDMVV